MSAEPADDVLRLGRAAAERGRELDLLVVVRLLQSDWKVEISLPYTS